MNSASETRLERAILSLDGLSVGDAFGQMFFRGEEEIAESIALRRLPSPPWYLTDDSIMAQAVLETIIEFGHINQNALAQKLAENYRSSPNRGYGGMAHSILRGIGEGQKWSQLAPALFDGRGSYGNGAAMRAGPLGAYFAEDAELVVREARRSAEVTHSHDEAIAGAIAVAVAAAWAVEETNSLYDMVLDLTPPGMTRTGIHKAKSLSPGFSIASAASILGNGINLAAQDTVPFCIWMVNRSGADYESALWDTVSALGDRDTTCAIVGSIIALRKGARIPAEWISRRESWKNGATRIPLMRDWCDGSGRSKVEVQKHIPSRLRRPTRPNP